MVGELNMTEKEKKLLVTDLSARVLCGVIISPADSSNAILIGCLTDGVILQDVRTGRKYEKPWELEYIKPYLRPLSSMTKEEVDEYKKISNYSCAGIISYGYSETSINTPSIEKLDWLNQHNFDYRKLIEKGLALEAPENMYNK